MPMSRKRCEETLYTNLPKNGTSTQRGIKWHIGKGARHICIGYEIKEMKKISNFQEFQT